MAKKDDGKSKTKSTKNPDWNKLGHEMVDKAMSTVPTSKKFKKHDGPPSEVIFDVPPILKKEKKPISEYHKAKSDACKKLRADAIEKLKNPPKAKEGRPSIYNEELADYIIKRVATTNLGLKALCESDDRMPDPSTVNNFKFDHPEFFQRYLVAKQMQAHLLAEECEDLAKEKHYVEDALGQKRVDPGFIASQRLQVDTRKWHTSRLNPTYFGDKKLVDEMRNQNSEMLAEIQALRAQLADKNKKDY